MYKVIREQTLPTGELAFQVRKEQSGEFFLLPEKYFEVLRNINCSFDKFCNVMNARNLSYTKNEYVSILENLQKMGLTSSSTAIEKKAIIKNLINSYLFFRLPIFNPNNLLNLLLPSIKRLVNPLSITLLFIISFFGYSFSVRNIDQFIAVSDNISTGIILPLSLGWVAVKLFHEIAHCVVAKLYKIPVRKFGIAFIFLTPRFYSDITDSVLLDKWPRIKIAAAGMFVEVIIGGFASIFFIGSLPGTFLSYFCASIVVITLLSTFIFNANPLMKFDGYYILSDLLDRPNLYQNGYLSVREVFLRMITGVKSFNIDIISMVYGIFSWCFRLFIYSSIIYFIYTQYDLKILVFSLCALEIYIFFLKPIFIILKAAFVIKKSRIVYLTNTLLMLGLIAGLFIPFPITKNTIAVITKSELMNTSITAPIDGFLYVEEDKIVFKDRVNSLNLELKKSYLDEVKLRINIAEQQNQYAKRETLFKLKSSLEEQVKFIESKSSSIDLSNLKLVDDIADKEGAYFREGEIITTVMSKPKGAVYFETMPETPPTGYLSTKHGEVIKNISLHNLQPSNSALPYSMRDYISCDDSGYPLTNIYVAYFDCPETINSQVVMFHNQEKISLYHRIKKNLTIFFRRNF